MTGREQATGLEGVSLDSQTLESQNLVTAWFGDECVLQLTLGCSSCPVGVLCLVLPAGSQGSLARKNLAKCSLKSVLDTGEQQPG